MHRVSAVFVVVFLAACGGSAATPTTNAMATATRLSELGALATATRAVELATIAAPPASTVTAVATATIQTERGRFQIGGTATIHVAPSSMVIVKIKTLDKVPDGGYFTYQLDYDVTNGTSADITYDLCDLVIRGADARDYRRTGCNKPFPYSVAPGGTNYGVADVSVPRETTVVWMRISLRTGPKEPLYFDAP